jgi:hypothetical protein
MWVSADSNRPTMHACVIICLQSAEHLSNSCMKVIVCISNDIIGGRKIYEF